MAERTAPALRWQMSFTSTLESARLVRYQTRRTLRAWGYEPEQIADPVLVVDELAANAIRHGGVRGRLFEVVVEVSGDLCRIEVSDAHDGRPVLRELNADDEGGRGLRLVAALSAEWGVRERTHGADKTVWAHVPLLPGEGKAS